MRFQRAADALDIRHALVDRDAVEQYVLKVCGRGDDNTQAQDESKSEDEDDDERDEKEVDAIISRLRTLYQKKFPDLASDCLVLHEKHIAFGGFGANVDAQKAVDAHAHANADMHMHTHNTQSLTTSTSHKSCFALAVLFYRLAQLNREAPVLRVTTL